MICRIVRNRSGTQDHRAHADLAGYGLVLKVHRASGAKFLARLAPSPFPKIDTLLRINRILLGNRLGIEQIDGLSLAKAGIIRINNALGTFFCTQAAGYTQACINVTGGLGNGDLEISHIPGYFLYLTKRQHLDVGVPADLDQLGRDNSHGALIGRKGLIQLRHGPSNGR